MSAANHYEVLGIAPSASAAEVRSAYVARARLLHPDRLHHLPPAEAARMARAMQDVNEAWRVLRSPASRDAYDARLAGRPVSPGAGGGRGAGWSRPPLDPDVDLDPTPYYHRPEGVGDPTTSVVRGLPWLAVLVVLGAIFVFTAFAGSSDDDDTRRSSYDLVGTCVQSQRGVGVVEVPCQGPNEGRVELVASRQGQCPDDTTVRPVPGEGTWVCLRPALPAAGEADGGTSPG
jgi:hypothetical protein